jgi:hypothetical protein
VTHQRDDEEERIAKTEIILEELRLNIEDLHELAKQTAERALENRRAAESTIARSPAWRAIRKAGQKR